MNIDVWILLVIAILNAITAALALMTKNDMKLLEKNTNSIMAQLVSTTRSEAHAAGMKEEKDKTP